MRSLALWAAIALAIPAAAQPPGPVVFSELMWMGSSASSADEWIELYNRSATEVNLAGWTITRLDKEEEQIMLQFADGKLAPGSTYLIANYKPTNARTNLRVEPQLVDAALSLPNTQLQLKLYAGDPKKDAPLIDTADDGKGAPMGGNSALKQAMVRIDFAGEGTDPQSWDTASEARGWAEDAAEMGTPGQLPSYLLDTSATPETLIEAYSWGQVKLSVE